MRIQEIEREIIEFSNVNKSDSLATELKSYFRSPFDFFGLTKKQINDFSKKLQKPIKQLDRENLIVLVNNFHYSNNHELKTFAIVLAANNIDKFELSDLEIFYSWLQKSCTWDHVDEICIRITGLLIIRFNLFSLLQKWSTDNHIWVRRASLISQLPSIRKNQYHYNLILECCSNLINEKDFFIRKAIGWVLRELSEINPEDSINITSLFSGRISKLSLKEATRKLDEDLKLRIIENVKPC